MIQNINIWPWTPKIRILWFLSATLVMHMFNYVVYILIISLFTLSVLGKRQAGTIFISFWSHDNIVLTYLGAPALTRKLHVYLYQMQILAPYYIVNCIIFPKHKFPFISFFSRSPKSNVHWSLTYKYYIRRARGDMHSSR